jgi:hypothetical protein
MILSMRSSTRLGHYLVATGVSKNSGPEHVDQCLATVSKNDAQHLRQKCPEVEFESKSEWIDAIRNEIITVLLPTCLRSRLGTPPTEVLLDESAKVISPEVWDHELAVEAHINASIDRALKRLIQSKAMKQMFPSLPEPRRLNKKHNEL